MADPFVAEIRIFAFNFAPKGWAFCAGQILPISQNTALFSLLGTTYGGDGKATFGLPDMQGNAPIHAGQSTTGTYYDLGQMSGVPNVTLIQTEMPIHTHFLMASNGFGASTNPDQAAIARIFGGGNLFKAPGGATQAMAPQMIAPAGGSQPHNNMQPYLVLNFCIALQGVFPARP